MRALASASLSHSALGLALQLAPAEAAAGTKTAHMAAATARRCIETGSFQSTRGNCYARLRAITTLICRFYAFACCAQFPSKLEVAAGDCVTVARHALVP